MVQVHQTGTPFTKFTFSKWLAISSNGRKAIRCWQSVLCCSLDLILRAQSQTAQPEALIESNHLCRSPIQRLSGAACFVSATLH